MQTTDVPPVFHSDGYATYCQNNLLCMKSDLRLLLFVFLCALLWRYIDKAMSILFSTITNSCFCLSYSVMISRPYAEPSSVKNKSSFFEVFSEKDVLKILIIVLKNDNEEILV